MTEDEAIDMEIQIEKERRAGVLPIKRREFERDLERCWKTLEGL